MEEMYIAHLKQKCINIQLTERKGKMKKYRVEQRASVWYETTVEANTEEEALEIAQSESNNENWELNLETVCFEDDYEIAEEE